ncbi:hypothetical protein ACMFMG_005350 [Clarireedia jacksonii]
MSTPSSTPTLTPEDNKLILAIFKQLDVSQFSIDYLQLAEDLGLSGGAGKGKAAASMRWVRFKKKMGKGMGVGVGVGGGGEDEEGGIERGKEDGNADGWCRKWYMSYKTREDEFPLQVWFWANGGRM